MFNALKLTYPGRRLDYSDPDWSCQIFSLIQSIEPTLTDAAIALSNFEKAKLGSKPSGEQWLEDRRRRQEIEDQIIKQQDIKCNSPDSLAELDYRVNVELSREKWEQTKELPDRFQNRLPFSYAQSYLYTMNRLYRVIGELNKIVKTKRELPELHSTFKNEQKKLRELMPNLHEVRNSVAHFENTIRGLDQQRKPIKLEPMQNEFISITGDKSSGILVENLHGNCFGTTLSDGKYGEVKISFQVLKEVCEIVQNILNAFQWKGALREVPIYVIY